LEAQKKIKKSSGGLLISGFLVARIAALLIVFAITARGRQASWSEGFRIGRWMRAPGAAGMGRVFCTD
jgi:hypothetical protein